jgi:hypothetical protein
LSCERPPHLGGVLVRVQPDLEDVVDQGQHRRQRKGRNEQSHESVLDDLTKNSCSFVLFFTTVTGNILN